MNARDHTNAMLEWWCHCGVETADVAVYRRNRAIIWHRDRPIDDLHISWLRFENARQAEIYIRPARVRAAPVVFLDDVDETMARAIAGKYSALVVRTSERGGCHVWLRASVDLDERHRRDAQRYLARRVGADPRSTSGEHLGRLSGFRNWKRNGCWVGVVVASDSQPWRPVFDTMVEPPASAPVASQQRGISDSSPSGRDWAQACSMLEQGAPIELVEQALLASARARGKRGAERYASRTASRCQERVCEMK